LGFDSVVAVETYGTTASAPAGNVAEPQAAELLLGILLLFGLWPRWTAIASALLLILFGVAMAISFGLKSPVDYSVFSASAAAFLLALNEPRTPGGKL
jgi:uncharacterized membrane protein YphA (DoxX/SURF4 family)